MGVVHRVHKPIYPLESRFWVRYGAPEVKEVLKMLGDTHAYRGSSRHALAALTRNLVVGDLALPMGHRMSFMNRVIVVLWSVF